MKTVTIRITESPRGDAYRAVGRWHPWSWVAFDGNPSRGGRIDLLATGSDRLTRAEVLDDINVLFGNRPDIAITIAEKGHADWPLRRAAVSA